MVNEPGLADDCFGICFALKGKVFQITKRNLLDNTMKDILVSYFITKSKFFFKRRIAITPHPILLLFSHLKLIFFIGCSHFVWTSANGGTCWLKEGLVKKSDFTSVDDPTQVCGVIDSNDEGSDVISVATFS